MPWKPGQSGNPGGRPKGPEVLRRLYHTHEHVCSDGEKRAGDAWIFFQLSKIINGGEDKNALRAIEVLKDRVYGKSATVDQDGETVRDTVINVNVPSYGEKTK